MEGIVFRNCPNFVAMRKLLLMVMCICYLASTAGVAVQWHYCMGKLRSVDIGLAPHSETCGSCGMQMGNNHCCKDEVSVSKLSDSHQQAPQLEFDFSAVSAILPSTFSLPAPVASQLMPRVANKAHAPPDISKDRSVLFCVFRC